jgi:membrane protease YdiL (CAAX protease family)
MPSTHQPTTRPAVAPGDEPATSAARRTVSHPVLVLSAIAIGIAVPLETGFLVAGLDAFPAKLLGLLVLLGTAVALTARAHGRPGVRMLFGALTTWRFGPGRWAMVLLAMPVLTVGVAAATGTLHAPSEGWAHIAVTYVVILVLIAVTGSLCEETAWTGFVQRRLVNRRGLLVGSMLTAIPFGLIHLPLAFEADGWAHTSMSEAFVNWAFVLGALPFLRYVAGVLLVDTRGSVLAVALLHASFNAAGAMSVIPAGWQQVPALVLLTVCVVVHRVARGRSLTDGRVDAVGSTEAGVFS